MSSTPCSKSTLYPSAARSVPQEGDLHGVHPQASFYPASSLVGQWGTQQVTEGRRSLKLECNPIYPLTHFMSEPSPHSPLGLWFQEVLLPLIPSDFREAASPSQAVSSPYPLSFVVFPLITLYIISLLNSPQITQSERPVFPGSMLTDTLRWQVIIYLLPSGKGTSAVEENENERVQG